MLINGWNFYILNPFDSEIEQVCQNTYIYMYNKALNNLINQLCIPQPTDIFENNKFIYCLDLNNDNDKITLEEEYEYTFLKSTFLKKKFKIIKKQIDYYYKNWGIYINSSYIDNNIFYLCLEKK